MNAMDLAHQPYLPNTYTWMSWSASDGHNNMPLRRKRKLDSGNHENSIKYGSESEQTWNSAEELTGELPAVQLNNLGVEMQQNYMEDEFLVFDSFNNFKQEIPSPSNSAAAAAADNHVFRQSSPVENAQKKYGNTDNSTERAYSPSKLAPSVASSSSSSSSSPQSYCAALGNVSSINNNNTTNSGANNGGANIGAGNATFAQELKTSKDCQVLNKENGNYNAEPHIGAAIVNATCPASSETCDDSFRFQYVLCAATSIAMKINEETLTYLNQGQPYEIKLKKLGDLTQTRGKIFKSIIRVLFHDRRLQYMERQQMSAWQASRPGDRILQLDLPLSYGISDHFQDPNALNAVQFLWDPTKDVGVYIKVNCISTEFTAKKHGGEKGVPFRIQIETYSHEKNAKSLHMASCQIKVFKLKGADRKHKQDREKIMKKSPIERENYQSSYECTVFSDMFLNGDPLSPCGTANSSVTNSPLNTDSDGGHTNGSVLSTFDYEANMNESLSDPVTQNTCPTLTLTRESSTAEMQYWLRCNRFGSYISRFENFTVSDMLSLSREDFIQICGIPDGIRLFNALPIVSKLTMYISTDSNSNIYHPIYLKSLTCQELISHVAPLIGSSSSQIYSGFVLGPHNSQIIITDDLVRNIKEETLFLVELGKETGGVPRNKLFLKPMSPTGSILSH